MRSTTKILSAIVFSFSTAVLGAGCNAAPVAEVASEEGSALAEDVGDIEDATEAPAEVDPIAPGYLSFCARCRRGCYRQLSQCQLYPAGGPLGYGRPNCRLRFRFCMDRCRSVCRRY